MKYTTSSRRSRVGIFTTGIVLAGILICILAYPASAEATGAPTVFIENFTITPPVLAPGMQGTITITLANTASTASATESTIQNEVSGTTTTTTTKDIPILVESVYLYGKGVEVLEGNFQHVGALGPGQSLKLTFLIRAPSHEGMYFPEVWIRIPDGTSVQYPIPVNVNSKDQVLRAPMIVVGKSLPDIVNPGTSFVVMLDLKNAGTLRANQITLSMKTSTTSIGVKGPTTLALSDLDGGASKPVELDFITDINAPLGLQQVNLQLNYLLPDGTTKEQTEQIQIPVKGKAEMSIASVTIDPNMPATGSTVNLIIRLENTGTDAAKSVIATIDLPMEGTHQAFIGKIKTDNDAPAIFTVTAGNPGDYAYNLTVNYSDEWGDHTLTRSLHLLVAPVDRTGLILLVLVLAAGAAFYFLYWRRRGGE
jgi:hypothetical protein